MYGTTLWSDLDRALFGPRRRRSRSRADLVRGFERLLDEGMRPSRSRGPVWRVNLVDQGDALELVAELPGVTAEDIDVTVQHDVLTVSAQRTVELPEDLEPHRRERRDYRFQRSLSLPVPVDAEQTRANLDDGILRVQMAKSPQHKPRQIQVAGNK